MKEITFPHRRAATNVILSAAVVRAISILIVAVVALGAAWLLTSCGRSTSESTTTYVSPYNWAGLQFQGDRLSYSENGTLRSDLGVDVSSHQGSIDWSAVALDGINFAIIRVGNRGYTEGSLYVDERFAENIDGAAAVGLETGVYFFSQAVNEDEARQEADLVIKQLDGRKLDLPVAYDHEPVTDPAGRANDMSGTELAACARAFCERVEAAGYNTIIYGNKQDIARFGGTSLGNRPVWLAEYDVSHPTAQFDFILWQYTNGGTVAGIPTTVDLNIRFLTT